MEILTGLAGLLIGAVAAWQLARGCTAAELSRLRARLEERIAYWQGETERARASAAQVAERTAAWMAGCEQGREDVLSLARALAPHDTRMGDAEPTLHPGEAVGQEAGPRTTLRSG